MPNIANLIEQKLKALPEDIRRSVASPEVPRKIAEIARKHNIHLDSIADIETEVMLIMLGLQDSKDFMRNLSSNAGLSKEMTEAVALEINEQIFQPIRNSLIGLTIAQESKEEKTESRAPLKPEGFTGPYGNNIKSGNQINAQVSRAEKDSPTSNISVAANQGKSFGALSLKADNLPAESKLSIVEQKLNAVVSIPKEEIKKEIPPIEKPLIKNQNRGYSVDPYREPTV